MSWRHDDDAVNAPVVVFVDAPGGPMDAIAADVDVTTFLNDRFHPVFRESLAGQPAGTVRFYDGCGCPSPRRSRLRRPRPSSRRPTP